MIETGDIVKHAEYGRGKVTWLYRSGASCVDFDSGPEREIAYSEELTLVKRHSGPRFQR